MNAISRIAALTLSITAAGTAFAGGDILAEPAHGASTLSRAEVQAAVKQAVADRTLRNHESDHLTAASAPGTLSRAEVRAETLRAIATGELRVLNDETSPYARQFRAAPAKSAVGQVAALGQ